MIRTMPVTIREFDLEQVFANVVDTLYRWQSRAKQRYQLSDLDPRALQDIGVTQAQASAEARKPFWLN